MTVCHCESVLFLITLHFAISAGATVSHSVLVSEMDDNSMRPKDNE